MAMINFGGVEERVVTREEFPLSRAQEVLKKETVAVLGYGVQGPGQSLNMRDNGIRVIVGQRQKTASWDKALKDGWVPGLTLFPLEEAAAKGTIIEYLLSDAGQKTFWPKLKSHLTKGKTLFLFPWFFNHLQRPDQGLSLRKMSMSSSWPQKARGSLFGATSWREAGSTAASPSFKIIRGRLKKGHLL